MLADDESAEDLQLLLAPGGSLGGAWPKASVEDTGGALMIAKFPSPSAEYNMVVWEAVALGLAERAGIPVSQWRLELVHDRQVLLVRRFDRNQGRRIPFLSAMSLLGATDGDPRSYREIADAIRMYGAQTTLDLATLWRRIVFTVMISNTDDHLRNHGFLYEGTAGWRLSPAYDLNPTPADVRRSWGSELQRLTDSPQLSSMRTRTGRPVDVGCNVCFRRSLDLYSSLTHCRRGYLDPDPASWR